MIRAATFDPASPYYGLGVVTDDHAWLRLMDAGNECEHGRLPTDRNTEPCGCWGGADRGTTPEPEPEPEPEPQAPVQMRAVMCHHEGGHLWQRPKQAGRLPRFCPVHQ